MGKKCGKKWRIEKKIGNWKINFVKLTGLYSTSSEAELNESSNVSDLIQF